MYVVKHIDREEGEDERAALKHIDVTPRMDQTTYTLHI
jgi:hypothetical protein